jgi:N-acetylglucosaminyldiphosphoundecaprenol N-acetyl-beta-D-mannosaminyltransferase
MNNYFGINLEFDPNKIHQLIAKAISDNQKGYVCVVDGNVLTIAQKNQVYCTIINNSLVNTCDGSSIAWLAGKIYKKDFRALTGPEIFTKYIESPYKQILLGSTDTIVEKIKMKLKLKGIEDDHIQHIPVPFLSVDKFNYLEIADEINKLNPDIIWVSLGAPKQEIFMSKILPFINKGVMFGIGAAFNFYIGEISIPRKRKGALQFIWLNRIFHEPKKQLKRILPYIAILPKLVVYEKIKMNESTLKSNIKKYSIFDKIKGKD